jgi:hypothetical protein
MKKTECNNILEAERTYIYFLENRKIRKFKNFEKGNENQEIAGRL